jgi:hypothetical protein
MGINVLWVPGKEGGAADSLGARDPKPGRDDRREGKIKEIREAKVESVVIETAPTEVAAVAAVFIFRDPGRAPSSGPGRSTISSASPSTASRERTSPLPPRHHLRRTAGRRGRRRRLRGRMQALVTWR